MVCESGRRPIIRSQFIDFQPWRVWPPWQVKPSMLSVPWHSESLAQHLQLARRPLVLLLQQHPRVPPLPLQLLRQQAELQVEQRPVGVAVGLGQRQGPQQGQLPHPNHRQRNYSLQIGQP